MKARSDGDAAAAVALSAIYRLSAGWQRQVQQQQQQQQHGSDLPDALFYFFIVITGALIQLADLPIQSVCDSAGLPLLLKLLLVVSMMMTGECDYNRKLPEY